MVFSYTLKIAGNNINNFGEMKITQNTDSYGLSGVCMSEFTFTMDANEYSTLIVPANSAVELSMENNYAFCPTYYIATRTKKNGKVSFKCFDRMIYIDQTLNVNNIDFEADGRATSQNVASYIAEQCGFEGIQFTIDSSYIYDFYILREELEGKSCRSVLETISKVWCGVFRTNGSNQLLFAAFGTAYYLDNRAQDHTSIDTGGEKGPLSQIIVSNGDDVYTAGNPAADVFGTVKIQTEYASQNLADNLLLRLEHYIYEAWSCDRCIIDQGYGNIEVPAQISFADGSVRLANNIVKYPTAQGIFISCSCNDVVENEFDYTGALSRKIETKIGDGEQLGNKTLITRYQGIVHLGEKKTDENGKETQSRYGYSAATAGGIVEFDGAITSRVVPQSAKINADKTEAVVAYGDKAYKYNISYADDGSISGFSKTEVTG